MSQNIANFYIFYEYYRINVTRKPDEYIFFIDVLLLNGLITFEISYKYSCDKKSFNFVDQCY